MNGEKRTRLEKEIRRYTLPQLKAVFFSAMNDRLENFAIADSLELTVFKLMEYLEMDDSSLIRFLSYLQIHSPWPELRSAIDDYFGILTADPFEAAVAYGEPILDHDDIRNDLRQLFNKPPGGNFYQALLAQGQRNSGRSHTKWLIQYITKNHNTEYLLVDLAESTLYDIVMELKYGMYLPPDRFPDSMAQETKQSKAFRSALGGYLKEQQRSNPGQIIRWCLVFDHYDLDEVQPEARLFVDDLVKYSVSNPELNIWIIVLGFNNLVLISSIPRILPTGLVQFGKKHIENFLIKVGGEKGKSYSPDELTEICDDILKLLNPPPWSKDEM